MQPKLNREQRRALKKKGLTAPANDTMKWDELHDLFGLCVQFLQTATLIEQPLREVAPYIQHPEHMNNVMSRVLTDSNQLIAELNTIKKHHEDKSGDATIDDITDLLSITQTYLTWMDRAKAVMEPAYDELVDIHYEAQKAKAVAEGLDVSTVQPMGKLNLTTI